MRLLCPLGHAQEHLREAGVAQQALREDDEEEPGVASRVTHLLQADHEQLLLPHLAQDLADAAGWPACRCGPG